MAKIKNMGTSTMRFGEGIIVQGEVLGTDYALVVTGSVIANSITGSLSGMATSAVTDPMGINLIGGIFSIDQGLFQNPNSSYNPIYFPADDTLTERVAPSSVNYFIAPFSGELIKVQIKSSTSFAGKTLTLGFHKGTGTDSAYSSTASAQVVLNGMSANSVYTFDFIGQSGSSFNAGNIFGYSLNLQGGYAGNENIHFACTIRYNPAP
tara:strand:+ start:4966 stop:5589 length:624 start_codon:yes stop_codon:yes gene_type:complete